MVYSCITWNGLLLRMVYLYLHHFFYIDISDIRRWFALWPYHMISSGKPTVRSVRNHLYEKPIVKSVSPQFVAYSMYIDIIYIISIYIYIIYIISTLYIIYYILYLYSILYIIYYILYLYSILYIIYYISYIIYHILYTVYCILYIIYII